MGDQRLELKIQEEEEDDLSKSEESKMSMILSKGWSVGKKIVITGMAISSAPIVLPPLVIFSSIGFAATFAVAVPFGIVYVSYACTQKLMSKLLSRPLKPPPLFEYKFYDDDDDDYVEVEEDFQEDGFCRGGFMDDDHEEEEEEKKFREDTKETLEMRIELIGDEKEGEGFVVYLNEEEKSVGMMEEESKETLYLDNYVEEEEKPSEDMNGVMEEEMADGMYFDNYVEEEEKPVEDMNGVMEEERADGMYFDYYVEEEEKPVEDMNGVMEEERADDTYFDNDVEMEEKPLEEYVGDTGEQNLRREKGGAMEDYREDEEEVDETVKVEKPVEVISDEIEEEELVMREREEVRDEENADIVIEIEGGGVKENVGSIEEIRSVRETEGVVEETQKSRPKENVGLMVVEEEKLVLRMEGEKGEASEVPAMPTVSSSLPRRKGRKKKGKKNVKKTAENMGEKERLMREAKGGIKDTRDEEPLDKLRATDNVEEPNAEEIGREQNVSGMAQEKYIVGKELPSLQVEIMGVREDENVSVVTQKDGNVEEIVPVLETPQEVAIVEEAVPVVDVMWEEPVVDVTQVGYIEEAVPVAEINEVIEKENVNDVIEKNYIAQQVVPAVEINGVTPMAEMNGVSKGENRDDKSVGKIADDVEQVRPIKGTKEVMGKNKEGVVLEKNTDNEEIPVEEVHGIVKVHGGVSLEQVSGVKEPTAQTPTEKTDSAEHPLSAEMEFNREAHEQEGIIPSKEVLYSEGKIWEQINAMRKIVGYKAALQTTCIEELKALYIFIGVEPPVAFRVPSDLAEINDKLHLLMSIIGVK